MMDDALAVRLEVEALLAEWAWRVDEGRAASAADLFCDDAEQSLLGAAASGIEQIRAAFQRRQDLSERRSQHVVSNIRVVRATPAEVDAQWVVTLYRHDGPGAAPSTPLLVGIGFDRYRRGASGELKIWRREVTQRFGA